MTEYYLTFGSCDVCLKRHWTGYVTADTADDAIVQLIGKLQKALSKHNNGELDLDRESTTLEELSCRR